MQYSCKQLIITTFSFFSYPLISTVSYRVWVQYKSSKSFYTKSLRDFSFPLGKHLRNISKGINMITEKEFNDLWNSVYYDREAKEFKQTVIKNGD